MWLVIGLKQANEIPEETLIVQATCFDPKPDEVFGEVSHNLDEPVRLVIGGVTLEFNVVDDESLESTMEALQAIKVQANGIKVRLSDRYEL